VSQHVSGNFYAHRQEIQLRSIAYSCLSCCSCCEAGESVGKTCALCGEWCLILSDSQQLQQDRKL